MSSVHLEKFPDVAKIPFDDNLIKKTRIVRAICNTGFSIRNANNIKVRTPISKMTIYCKNNPSVEQYYPTIMEELNVKQIEYSNDVSSIATKVVSLNLKVCGAKFGSDIQRIIKATKNNEYLELPDGNIKILDHIIEKNDFSFAFIMKNEELKKSCSIISQNESNEDMFLELDTNITEDLLTEGIIRNIIRSIQQNRKKLDLKIYQTVKIAIISDSIKLSDILQDSLNISYISGKTFADRDFFRIWKNKDDFYQNISDTYGYKVTISTNESKEDPTVLDNKPIIILLEGKDKNSVAKIQAFQNQVDDIGTILILFFDTDNI